MDIGWPVDPNRVRCDVITQPASTMIQIEHGPGRFYTRGIISLIKYFHDVNVDLCRLAAVFFVRKISRERV